MSSAEDAIARAEELLDQLNARRDELERLAGAEDLDAEAAVQTIAELAELAKQIEAELTVHGGSPTRARPARMPVRSADELRDAIEAYLGALPLTKELGGLEHSLRYALESGGKRIRPILCLAVAEAAGGSVEDALPGAAAVELVHTFSLVHDDLPGARRRRRAARPPERPRRVRRRRRAPRRRRAARGGIPARALVRAAGARARARRRRRSG